MRIQTQRPKKFDLPKTFERTPISSLAVFLFNPGLTALEYKKQFFPEKTLLNVQNLCTLLYREGVLRIGVNDEICRYYPTGILRAKVKRCDSSHSYEEIMQQPIVDFAGTFKIEEWEDVF